MTLFADTNILVDSFKLDIYKDFLALEDDIYMESTCGALIGAVMVAGILTDGKGTPRISKELVQNFERKCGATICKDLKGIETGKVLCPCPECVRNAVLSLGEALGE